MKFKDLKIRYKFILSFGIALVMIIALAIGSILGITQLLSTSHDLIVGNKMKALFAQKEDFHLQWAMKLSNAIINREKGLEITTNGKICDFGNWYYSDERREAEKIVPGLKPYLQDIRKPHEDLHETAAKIRDLLNTGTEEDYRRAVSIYQEQTVPLLDRTLTLLTDMHREVDAQIVSEQGLIDKAHQIQWVVLIISLFTVIAGSLLAFAIAHNIAGSIRGISRFVGEVGQGNLDADFDFSQKDEMGKLVMSFKRMLNRIREVMGNVNTASRNVTEASMQLSNTSQDISQGASEQASSVEEVSSSIQQMTANIQQNTDNARQTENIASKAASDIEKGSEKVHTTMEAMKSIADKISIIGDIAFQTNILALNAAVEAARAGEHGKGFGVVAAEVGKLAERSKAAAAEIDEISRQSVDVAEEAADIMKTIVPDIQKTSQLVQEIAAASMEQNAGAEQINNAVQQLNEVTQQNAAASEEMATSAEELSAQADQLLDVVSFFRTNKITHVKPMSNAQKPVHYKNTGSIKPEQPKQTNTGKGFNIELGDDSDSEFERF